MIVIAHRGASRDAPENTLPAFQLACELGADMIELDVRLAADNTVVVSHDKVDQSRLDIPTLTDALALLKGKCAIDIELKETATLEPVVDLVRKMNMIKEVVLTSFDHQVIIKLKQKHQAFKAGFII